MVTVKDILFLLKDANEILIAWDGFTRQISKDNELDVDAYGKYIVKQISSFNPHEYELAILVQPVKA